VALNRDSNGIQAYWFLAVSLLSLGFIPAIVFSGSVGPAMTRWQSQIVWFAFIAVCISGTLAGVRPSGCSRRSADTRSREGLGESQQVNKEDGAICRRGHHYSCSSYAGHIISFGDRVYCAGCTGLALGGTIAATGSAVYLISGATLGSSVLLFWLGFVGVAVGLLQHPIYRAFKVKNGFVRIGVNVAFVNGAFLVLLAVTELAGNFGIDAYVLLVILFWISTRIAMSRGEHLRICAECPELHCYVHQSIPSRESR
jgi:hypothetical protein